VREIKSGRERDRVCCACESGKECVSVYLCLCRKECVSVFLSLSLCLSVSLCLCLCVSVSLCVCVCAVFRSGNIGLILVLIHCVSGKVYVCVRERKTERECGSEWERECVFVFVCLCLCCVFSSD